MKQQLTPLLMASGRGHAPAVTLLIESGADVNKPEPCQGITALHVTAKEGHVQVMELLITKGARVDVRSNDGRTPLYLTIFDGHKEAAIYLLDHGAEVNAAAIDGYTPLPLKTSAFLLSISLSFKGLIQILQLMRMEGRQPCSWHPRMVIFRLLSVFWREELM